MTAPRATHSPAAATCRNPRTVTIEVPLPPTDCMPNQRAHWRFAARAVKQYRQEAYLCALSGRAGQKDRKPLCPPVRISADLYQGRATRGDGRYRPLDTGNAIASLKAAIDGIVDSGLIPGDSHKLLRWGEVRLLRTAKEHQGRACVVLTFEESGAVCGEELSGGGTAAGTGAGG